MVESLKGIVAVLNVGKGDTKLSFDPANEADRERAAGIVVDMIRMGYAVMIEAGKTSDGKTLYTRADGFDPQTFEYIVLGIPAEPTTERKRRGRKSQRRVPAMETSAVAIAPRAGG